MTDPGPDPTADTIVANIAAVHERIAAACRAADRDPADVLLVAVSKTHSAAAARVAVEHGLPDLGESKAQEGVAKAAELADLDPPPTWHFIGRLQRNKAKAVAGFADVIQSVDRSALVRALGGAVDTDRRAGRPLRVLIQVDLDPARAAQEKDSDSPRGGAHPLLVPELAEQVATTPGLRLDGLMAIAPLDGPADAAFARLQQIAGDLRVEHPDATVISAGMSGDLEEAVANGATWVRVGTALFGARQLTSHTP